MTNDKDSAVLAPCPFCGGEAEVEQQGANRQSHIIACINCGCSETWETWNAGSLWNTRQPTQSDAQRNTPIWTEAATIQTNGSWDGNTARSDALREENERLREHLISALDTLKDAEVCDDNCGPCNEARAALQEQSK